jgi:hypothetical protein
MYNLVWILISCLLWWFEILFESVSFVRHLTDMAFLSKKTDMAFELLYSGRVSFAKITANCYHTSVVDYV